VNLALLGGGSRDGIACRIETDLKELYGSRLTCSVAPTTVTAETGRFVSKRGLAADLFPD
jgi:hypothetical protein